MELHIPLELSLVLSTKLGGHRVEGWGKMACEPAEAVPWQPVPVS